jgi:hypothetical protein
MVKFVVDLGDHPLTPEQHHALAAAIHGAVLQQIATHPVPAGASPMAAVATIDGMMRRPAQSDLSGAQAKLNSAAAAP